MLEGMRKRAINCVAASLVGLVVGATFLSVSSGALSRPNLHVVVAGDTLTQLALRSGISVREIVAANPGRVRPNGQILVGATLKIPIIPIAQTIPLTLRADRERLRLRPVIRKWAKRNDIPADLVEATLYLESGWNQQRTSSTGAIGVGQLMPGTATFIKASLIGPAAGGLALDATRTEDNIRMSARYLRFLLAMTGGDATKALHRYYQGAGSITTRGLYNDTIAYAAAIQTLRGRFRADGTGI